MRAKKFAATALLAVGATGITAGVAAAQPVSNTEFGVRGVDHGIAYVAAPSADGRGITTSVDAGRFVLAADGRSVSLTDAAGGVVATVPLALRAVNQTIALAPRIDAEGRTLTLTPQADAAQTATAIDEAADTLARKQYNAGIGALIGAGIGAVIGFFLGGVGALVTVPIGAGIGALIGFSTP
ncbi:hypothetical protein [Nocardia arizonensis]|uniref:hypothetical protein n=1 Tax=Nocardia arizonensis TaxID=1141647 RepID=UPI0006D1D12A|nr:hypothetical protein [Nocardia arizonensis]